MKSLNIIRCDSAHPGFRELEPLLDAELRIADGADADFYAQYNKSDKIRHVLVGYIDEKPVACGAIKEYTTDTAEVKRMYVLEEFRGQRLAEQILSALEAWALELGYASVLLETGKKQPSAIRLYQRTGYLVVPNYGQYAGMDNSVCMKKSLRETARK